MTENIPLLDRRLTHDLEIRLAQARALCLVAALAAALACFSALHSAADAGQTAPLLVQRINPNTAPLASLVRLPGVGPGRAEALIRTRTAWSVVSGDWLFNAPDDLRRIRGIGPRTTARIAGLLAFEGGQQNADQ
jgi:DNA uptake protein ComE-like DNA-binding protein